LPELVGVLNDMRWIVRLGIKRFHDRIAKRRSSDFGRRPPMIHKIDPNVPLELPGHRAGASHPKSHRSNDKTRLFRCDRDRRKIPRGGCAGLRGLRRYFSRDTAFFGLPAPAAGSVAAIDAVATGTGGVFAVVISEPSLSRSWKMTGVVCRVRNRGWGWVRVGKQERRRRLNWCATIGKSARPDIVVDDIHLNGMNDRTANIGPFLVS
jgi:hypothetical protein